MKKEKVGVTNPVEVLGLTSWGLTVSASVVDLIHTLGPEWRNLHGMLGPEISEHIGNYGWSAAILLSCALVGNFAEKYGSERIPQSLAKKMPEIGFLFGLGLNLVAESAFLRNPNPALLRENVNDLGISILALSAGLYAWKYATGELAAPTDALKQYQKYLR